MVEEQYVPIEVVAKRFSVSPATIRSWVRQRYIPKETYAKIGNTYRFDVEAIVKVLVAQPDNEVEVPSAQEDAVRVNSPVQLELNFNPDEDL